MSHVINGGDGDHMSEDQMPTHTHTHNHGQFYRTEMKQNITKLPDEF